MAKSFYNIEKSAFRPGEYVGWSASMRWKIKKDGTVWVAVSPYGHTRHAATLAGISEKLEAFND
jgi:hypothetical protein